MQRPTNSNSELSPPRYLGAIVPAKFHCQVRKDDRQRKFIGGSEITFGKNR